MIHGHLAAVVRSDKAVGYGDQSRKLGIVATGIKFGVDHEIENVPCRDGLAERLRNQGIGYIEVFPDLAALFKNSIA